MLRECRKGKRSWQKSDAPSWTRCSAAICDLIFSKLNISVAVSCLTRRNFDLEALLVLLLESLKGSQRLSFLSIFLFKLIHLFVVG